MRALVSGATVQVRAADPARVGVLMRPGQGICRDLLTTRVWAADNAAFVGFDAVAFRSMLRRLRGMAGCRFVAAPDVVSDAVATWRLFGQWAPEIRSAGHPVALVAQDGLSADAVPWHAIDALFIGGSTGWKLSATVDALLAEAARRGKWRHIGRVNTLRRVQHFAGRCESFDGSGFSRFPRRIAMAERWIGQSEAQPRLFGGAPRPAEVMV